MGALTAPQKATTIAQTASSWNKARQNAFNWCPFGLLKALKTVLPLQRECVWHFLTMSPKSPQNGAQIYVIWERLTSQAAPKGAQSDHQDPKMSPKAPRRLSIKSHGTPEGSQRLPKGCPKGPKCHQKAFTKFLKRSQRVPKGFKGAPK